MHCPYHHYLTAAALLTSAALNSGYTREKLCVLLKTARELVGVDAGEFSTPVCHYFKQNRECLKIKCPFFPRRSA